MNKSTGNQKHLTLSDRITIEKGLKDGKTFAEIGRETHTEGHTARIKRYLVLTLSGGSRVRGLSVCCECCGGENEESYQESGKNSVRSFCHWFRFLFVFCNDTKIFIRVFALLSCAI